MSEHPRATLSVNSSQFHAQNINNTVNNTQTIGQQTQTIYQTQTFLSRCDPIDILRHHVASGALYNSKERYDPPKCHPQTRTAVLQRIERWAAGDLEDSESKPIMWLSGPAGAGKSAIAQTLVEKWKKEKLNILSFFFWRTSSERNQSTRLVATLASELIGVLPAIKDCIKAAIDTGEVFNTNLTSQVDTLVVEPLRKIAPSRPVVIMIDGLDECCIDLPKDKDFPGQTHESQQREILEAFGSACRAVPYLRLIIVSRPERQIRASFGIGFLEQITTSVSLKNVEDASADIRLFLDCNFQEIRKRFGIKSCWPTEDQLCTLVRKSSGQFIYPSIAIKHITRTRADPKRSLMAVLELKSGSADNPLAELDMLYTLVLKSVSEESISVVTDILGYMLPYKREVVDLSGIFNVASKDRSLSVFGNLLFLPDVEVELHLDDLHSVLDIPPRATNLPIRFIHATFSEYLQDSSRARNFFISDKRVCIRYAELLFRHLNDWGMCSEDHICNGQLLIAFTCTWIDGCPNSRALMIYIWSLMGIKLGRYPLAGSHANKDSLPPASKQLSAQFHSQLEGLDNGTGNGYTRNILKYLQKCNIPETEPSWCVRFQVRLRLKVALWRHPKHD